MGMIDRENVMTWLEICGKNRDCSGNCPYGDGSGEYEDRLCREDLMADALALLKEQEAKKVLQIRNVAYRTIGYCPSCGRGLDSYEDGNSGNHITNYCYNCGQAVKWE